jgi:hypothetical protein
MGKSVCLQITSPFVSLSTKVQMTNFRLFDEQMVNELLCLPCLWVSTSPYPCLNVSGIPQRENGTNRKGQLPFVFCKQEMEMANFNLFAANGNRNQMFVYPWVANDKQ